MGAKDTIETLVYALYLATERAIKNGDRLVKLGENDVNRGQFLAVVNKAVCEANSWIEIPEICDFEKLR